MYGISRGWRVMSKWRGEHSYSWLVKKYVSVRAEAHSCTVICQSLQRRDYWLMEIVVTVCVSVLEEGWASLSGEYVAGQWLYLRPVTL